MASEIPASHLDILGKEGLAHVATIGPQGMPQSTPVWYAWDGQQLAFSTTRGRRKCKNLTRNPKVALSIIDPDNPYRYLQIQGVATIIDDPEKLFIEELAHRYTGGPFGGNQPGDERVIIRVTPQHVTVQG